MTTIDAVMSRKAIYVDPDTSVLDAARMMREQDIGAILVGENDRLVGMVTDRDIAIRGIAEGIDPGTVKVRDVMSERIAYCFADQDEDEAAKMMAEKKIRRLAVLNRDKRLVGLVSLGDIAANGGHPVAGQTLETIARA